MPMSSAFRQLARAVNNWGRWGDRDEIGTLNLVGTEAVRRGAASVRSGERFSLALPLSSQGPQIGAVPGRVNPLRTMVAINTPMFGDPTGACFSDDVVVMGLQAATHWDSLAHVSYDGRLYNGFPVGSVTAAGAAHCGIDRIGSLVTRGVLLDVARATGVDRLEPGHVLTAEELSAAEEHARVRVEPGDVVLLRTGHIALLHAGDRTGYHMPSPGPSMQTARWFRERDVAAVATDTITFEVFPCEGEDLMPVHLLHLVEMGLTQGQNWDLEELAADCADDGVYTFLLEASPQPFVGGLGSPVNPVAVK